MPRGTGGIGERGHLEPPGISDPGTCFLGAYGQRFINAGVQTLLCCPCPQRGSLILVRVVLKDNMTTTGSASLLGISRLVRPFVYEQASCLLGCTCRDSKPSLVMGSTHGFSPHLSIASRPDRVRSSAGSGNGILEYLLGPRGAERMLQCCIDCQWHRWILTGNSAKGKPPRDEQSEFKHSRNVGPFPAKRIYNCMYFYQSTRSQKDDDMNCRSKKTPHNRHRHLRARS